MNGEGKRILIVEDDPGLLFTMTDALEENGFAVTGADNGGDAIRRLLDGAFDVVVTDLRLPDKDGMEVLREARKKIPAPSVVVMTGYGSVESAVAAMKSGAEDYLTKPFPVEALLLLLDKIFRQTASPRPVPSPLLFVVKNGSKTFSRFSGGIPSPVSETIRVRKGPSTM